MRGDTQHRECGASSNEWFGGRGGVNQARQGLVSSQRAITPVLALVLLMLVVSMSVVAILVGGQSVLTGFQSEVDVDHASASMHELDSQITDLSVGDSDATVLALGGGEGQYSASSTAGRVTITHYNYTGLGDNHTLYDLPLGEVAYQNGDTQLVMQGGGIWRTDGAGSVMLESPDLYVRDGTLHVHLPRIASDTTSTGITTATATRTDRSRVYPSANSYPNGYQMANPIANGSIAITVQSEYYDAWGRHLAKTTGRPVTFDHAAKTATVDFSTYTRNVTRTTATVYPPGPIPGKPLVMGAVVSPFDGGSLTLNHESTVDSYDSSLGNYTTTRTTDGEIYYGGNVTLSGNASVEGNVNASGTVDVGTYSYITGDLAHGSGTVSTASVGGTVSDTGSVPVVEPVTDLVNAEVDRIEATNDNGATTAISGTTLQCASGCTLTAGEYSLSELTLKPGETLVVDTTAGDVTLAVDGNVSLKNNAHIEVVGSNQFTVYTTASAISFNSGTTLTAPENRATQVWLFGLPGTVVELNHAGSFTGVIYVPGDEANPSDIRLNNAGAVYGAIVGRVTEMNSDSNLHFDLALRGDIGSPVFPYEVTTTNVSYELQAGADISSLIEYVQCTDHVVTVSFD